jgi:hypothetical protein
MNRPAILALCLALVPLAARADESEAKTEAQAILDKGSALFDKRDAAAMAATYTEDAQIFWTAKQNESAEPTIDTKKGRTEIEGLYRDLFKDGQEKTTSKNVVEFARRIAPEVLVIQGTFQPDTEKPGKYPFVQVRVKQGDTWRIKSLQFFVYGQD